MKLLLVHMLLLIVVGLQKICGKPSQCNGSECPLGTYSHSNGICQCCIDCEMTYHRESTKECPLIKEHCGNCLPGYIPNMIQRPDDPHSYCKPDPKLKPEDVPPLPKQPKEVAEHSGTISAGIFAVLGVVSVSTLGLASYYGWRKLRSNQQQPEDIQLEMLDFGRPLNEAEGQLPALEEQNPLVPRRNLKSRLPEESEETCLIEHIQPSMPSAPLVLCHEVNPDTAYRGGRGITTSNLVQAQPIDPTELNVYQTFDPPNSDDTTILSNASDLDATLLSILPSTTENANSPVPPETTLPNQTGSQHPDSIQFISEDSGVSGSISTTYSNASTIPMVSQAEGGSSPTSCPPECRITRNNVIMTPEGRLSLHVSVEVAAEHQY